MGFNFEFYIKLLYIDFSMYSFGTGLESESVFGKQSAIKVESKNVLGKALNFLPQFVDFKNTFKFFDLLGKQYLKEEAIFR